MASLAKPFKFMSVYILYQKADKKDGMQYMLCELKSDMDSLSQETELQVMICCLPPRPRYHNRACAPVPLREPHALIILKSHLML